MYKWQSLTMGNKVCCGIKDCNNNNSYDGTLETNKSQLIKN